MGHAMAHYLPSRQRSPFLTGSGDFGLFRSYVLPLAFVLGMATAAVRAQSPDDSAKVADSTAPASIADLKDMERQIRATLDKVTPSVVAVSGGSGVVVSEDGIVLTVAHVVGRAGREVTITFPDGRVVKGKTLGNDRGVDAGLVKITDEGSWPHAEMGKSAGLRAGQWCLTLGYPVSFERGKAPVVRIGRVLENQPSMIVTDGTIMGGDSGGPLIDLEGRVIGIGSRCDNTVTTNIHIPIDRYHDNWDRLVNGEDFNSLLSNVAFLGVAPDESSDDARIGRVIPGSAAEKAGIQVGDLILKLDGHELKEYAELPALIRSREPGDEVEIEVRRGEETLKIEATLGRFGG
jgi:serine protease Do